MLARPHQASALFVGVILLLNADLVVAAAERIPDQVLVLRSPSTTSVQVSHVRGDEVAVVTLRRPPLDATQILRAQRGVFIRDVEHLSREGDSLKLLLRLSTDAVTLSARRIRRPSAWTITLTPDDTLAFPAARKTIGYLPGLTAPPHKPVLFPAAPEDTPCAGQPDGEDLQSREQIDFQTELELEERLSVVTDPVCRHWVLSRYALRAMEADRNLEPFERWAFLFAIREEGWAIQKEAYAQVSLVVAELLSRQAYEPEAETLLREATRYRRSHAPFRAMALANHLSRQERFDEAETLYKQLVTQGFEPWIIHRASLARALNSLDGGDVMGTLAHVEKAAQLIGEADAMPGDLWMVGGEAALAKNELALARQHFERAARGSTAAEKGMGLLRLADLEARAGRTKSARKGWLVAEAMGGPECLSDHIHLRRVLSLERDRSEVIRFLESNARYSRCDAVRMEADYARALVHLKRGEELAALAPVLRVISRGSSRWGLSGPHRAMLTRVARKAVETRARHHDPAALVTVFEEELEKHARALDPRTRLLVGKAYVEVGAAARGASELMDLLLDEPSAPFREELLLSLGEGFLASGDVYRTDLILRHLETKYPTGPQSWRRFRLLGRFEAQRGRPGPALAAFGVAKSKLPSGDRRAEIALDTANALLARNRVPAAIEALLTAASSPRVENSQLLPAAIRGLSECARVCSQPTLRRATRSLVDRLGMEAFTPRLVSRLARRRALATTAGTSTAGSPPSTALWSRLDALEAQARAGARRAQENP